MLVRFLGLEDPLGEEGMAAHSGVLIGKSHEQRSLMGCSPWVHRRVRHDGSDLAPRRDPSRQECSSILLSMLCKDMFMCPGLHFFLQLQTKFCFFPSRHVLGFRKYCDNYKFTSEFPTLQITLKCTKTGCN